MRKPILILLSSLCVGFAAKAQTTLFVPGSYATIQAAVNASTHPLDIIEVAAGSYGTAVTINKSLQIHGPNFGIAGSGVRGAEASVTDAKITVTGANTVVIDGLQILQTNTTPDAVSLGGAATVTFQNCVVERNGITAGAIVRGIVCSAGSGAKTIQHNLFKGDPSGGLFSGHKTWNSGVYLNATGSTVQVASNTFRFCRTAINIDDFNSNVSISGNLFDNNGTHLAFGGVLPTDGQYVMPANQFTTPGDAIINLSKVATTFRLDITSSSFNGLFFSNYPLSTLFQIEQTMYHRGRASRNGLVTYVSGNQYVIPLNPSIQAAINYGEATQNIHIAPGSYTENLNLTRKINLLGSGSGNDPSTSTLITQTGAGAGDTRVGVIQINASGMAGNPVMIKDLRVLPNGMAGISVGRFTQSTGTNVSHITLNNVHVYGTFHDSPCTEQERGLYVDKTSTLSNLTITNSAFNGLDYGWYLHKDVSADASTVSNVSVSATTFNDNVSKGLYAEKLTNATFDGCTVLNNGDAAWGNTCTQFKAFLAGFDINLKAGNYQNITIKNSVFTGNATGQAKEGVAIALKARDDGATYGPFPAALNNVVVENCIITGNERGIRMGEPDKSNASPTGVVIRNNAIFGNNKSYTGTDGTAYGNIINLTAPVATATCNWLGANTSAAISPTVSGPVTFVPFLENGNDGSAAIGFQPTAACIQPVACGFTVSCFSQGKTHSGANVPALRSNPELARVAQKNDAAGTINFFSLGYGGNITLKSDCPVNNGPGNDITVWETTYGAQPVNANSDRARVYASQDGINFAYLGMATYDGSFDLTTAGLSWALYFRVVDATIDALNNTPLADAYDLDGIEVLNGYAQNVTVEPVTLGGAASVCGGTQGKTKNFGTIAGIRSQPSKATGLPQNDDTYNFYALGFGGDICLKFDFAVFDGPGDDLKVIETTFGTAACNTYREQAEISVSADGETWNVLGTYCQDYTGGIDLTPANNGIQYVRFRDVSNRADFTSPSADGYDLDAVVALGSFTGTPVCNPTTPTRRSVADFGLFDQTEVPDEIETLRVMQNLDSRSTTIRFSMVAENATVSVSNMMGQQLMTKTISGNLWDVQEVELPSHIGNGVFVVTVNSGVQKESVRFQK